MRKTRLLAILVIGDRSRGELASELGISSQLWLSRAYLSPRYRLYKFLNRKSQRRYRLKYAETYYGELQKLGLIALSRRRYR
jgi:hypothetical protein